MSDIVQLYGPHYAVRPLADAWRAAGSPPINSAGRLYADQKGAWVAYQNGTGSPADDPDRPDLYPLAHVRFAAIDVTPTPDRVRALAAAGLVRPYEYEPWHWELPNVRAYPLVLALPAATNVAPLTLPERNDDMPIIIAQRKDDNDAPKGLYDPEKGRIVRHISQAENRLLRSAERAGGALNGTILYGSIDAADFKALGG